MNPNENENEQRQASIYDTVGIESAGDAIYVIEAGTGRIQNCNGRACLDLGYSKDELLQLSSQDIEVRLTAGEVDTIHHALKPGQVKTIDGVHRRKDGSVFPVEIRLSSLAPAQPEFMLAIVRDVTERKQFEEKLRKSEARYQLIFENSGTANTIFDTECRVVLQNSQSQKLTQPADALGKTALEVFGPEQGPIVNERMRRVMASGVAEVFETQFDMPTGNRWIRSSYQPLLDEQQGVVGIQVISQDISAQKQAEKLLRETSERLAHMLANSPTVIYALKVTGDQAAPIWISENIETVLGFRPEDAMQPAWWLGQVHPEDRSSVQASLKHLFDDFYQHEYHFMHKDGHIIWLHDEHRLLRDANNAPREIIGAWTDITERKQAEEALRDYNVRLALDVVERTRELQEAQEKLVRQEKLAVLGQLAGGVGHELRNPLAVINNAVYYLKLIQPDADEKVRKYHNMIEHEVRNSEKIINDLLDFARLKSAEREPVAVPDLVQACAGAFPGTGIDYHRARNSRWPATSLRRPAPDGAGTGQPGCQCLPGHGFDQRSYFGRGWHTLHFCPPGKRAGGHRSERHRHRHHPRKHAEALRAALHHQAQGHRAGSGGQPETGRGQRRPDRGAE